MVYNGLIINTRLGEEDNGIFTFTLSVLYERGVINVGNYGLSHYEPTNDTYYYNNNGLRLINAIIDTVGADCWENLKNKYIRLDMDKDNKTVKKIGNILNDNWLDIHKVVMDGIEE